jgi:hypothetical protein
MDESQLPNVLAWLKGAVFGQPKDQPTVYPASQPTQYPTSDDVDFARKNDYSYGQPWAPEFEGKSARLLTGDPNQVPIPATTLGSNIPIDRRGSNMAPLEDYYAKAALASERSALAKLGFDPNKAAIDVGTNPANVSVLGQYKSSKGGTDQIYANARTPSTLVHESIHRGIQKLKDSPFWKPEFNDFSPATANDELLVRHLMQSRMGDPTVPEFKSYMPNYDFKQPVQQGSGRELEATARALFDPNQSSLAKSRQKTLDAMEAAAANYIAQRRPGGPR